MPCTATSMEPRCRRGLHNEMVLRRPWGRVRSLDTITTRLRSGWRLHSHTKAERFVTEEAVGLEVLHREAQPSSSGKPPLVFVHGLFRAAWCWDEHFLPYFSAQGYDCYALSLRGQGGSDDVQYKKGVPLAVNVRDIITFAATLPRPPVLVGHSLGGYFVQECLVQGASQALPSSSMWSGAVLLGSATAGTVMDFGGFIREAGLREFLYQMWVVFSNSHLKDREVAQYCWWPQDLPDDEKDRYFSRVTSSSRVSPYIVEEVGAWHPDPQAPEQLPPVLALGGAQDRIILPFQVSAAQHHYGAECHILEGVTHDMMLGEQAGKVAGVISEWLRRVEVARHHKAAGGTLDSSPSIMTVEGSALVI